MANDHPSRLKESLYHSSHLISYDLISVDLISAELVIGRSDSEPGRVL